MSVHSEGLEGSNHRHQEIPLRCRVPGPAQRRQKAHLADEMVFQALMMLQLNVLHTMTHLQMVLMMSVMKFKSSHQLLCDHIKI